MNSREEYLNSVCREVRFHAARKYVKQELSNHIDDKKAYLEQCGTAGAEAEAVNAMGDPVQTGRALNAIHRPRMEWGIIACVLALTILGVALSFIGMFELNIDGNTLCLASFHAEWAMLAVGLAAMVLLIFADYRWIVRLRYVCFGAGLACIAAFIVYTLLYPRIDFWAPGLLDTGSESTAFNVILGGITLKKIVTAVSSVLFVLGAAGFAYSRKRWSAADMALHLGFIVVSSCAVGILFYSQFALLVAVAGLVILLVSLLHSPLSKAQKWPRLVISIVAVAVPLTLCVLFLSPQPTTEGRDVLSLVFPGAVIDHASIEYQLFTQPGSTDSAAISAFKAYGWLLSLGATLIFLAMLALLVRRSLKVKDALGRMLMLGICAVFSVRFLLFILSILGVKGSLTAGIPFISDGMSPYLFSSLLVGLFLSVWRRSSFMRGQDSVTQVAYQ